MVSSLEDDVAETTVIHEDSFHQAVCYGKRDYQGIVVRSQGLLLVLINKDDLVDV